jgi:acyl-CoA synthetase (NDP forming)
MEPARSSATSSAAISSGRWAPDGMGLRHADAGRPACGRRQTLDIGVAKKPGARGAGSDAIAAPRSIAVVGGGAWCENALQTVRRFGFQGPLWAVHPRRAEVAGVQAFASLDALPGVPDAVFLGVNRMATVQSVATLSAMGAGGAICFASGFLEAIAELSDGADLQADLVAAAGEMPILGPNCYGLLNALDQVALWPDQHGLIPVERGVAIIGQSSNIALNLTMQRRGLPVAYIATAGNQAQTGMAEIGQALLRDPRVTALGLHIEGFGDIAAFEDLAATARDLGKAIVALKVGASAQAQAATVSHTASLAGSDAGARAVFARLGIGQVESLGAFLETLKLLHVCGPLPSDRVASMSCSGGEASLMADTGLTADLRFPDLTPAQRTALRAALGPKVALANPLDYHTYIWGDVAAMTATFAAMMQGEADFGCVVLDFPRADRCDTREWDKVIDAIEAAQMAVGKPIAVLASLPDTLPEQVAQMAMARGVLTLSGLPDALAAIGVAARIGQAAPRAAIWAARTDASSGEIALVPEAEAKARLAAQGMAVPRARVLRQGAAGLGAVDAALADLDMPVAVKAMGLAHKTEAGGLMLNLSGGAAVQAAISNLPAGDVLIEEMVTDGVAELLIGVVADPPHGFVLTLGAGGTLTELWQDTVSCLLPVTDAEIEAALARLRIAPVLRGYRGASGADRAAIVAAVMAVQDYVNGQRTCLVEIEINPLICTPTRAVAVDALIRERSER